jgi:hypothetical protein
MNHAGQGIQATYQLMRDAFDVAGAATRRVGRTQRCFDESSGFANRGDGPLARIRLRLTRFFRRFPALITCILHSLRVPNL